MTTRFSTGTACIATLLLLVSPLALAGENTEVLCRHDSQIEVKADYSRFTLPPAEILKWIDIAVEALHAYYGRLPFQHLELNLEPFEGRGVGRGVTFKTPQPEIRVTLGSETTSSELRRDWKLTHEFVHLTLPTLERHQSWLDEGIATYVEAIARYKIDNVEEKQVWRWLVEMVPNALSPEIKGGLDNTRRWGTVYWGGALFCLLADIDIRLATGNKKGLRHALRGALSVSVGDSGRTSAREFLTTADQAIGGTALVDLYERLRLKPFQVEPEELWQRLGVKRNGQGDIVFEDTAEWAHIRKAITRD